MSFETWLAFAAAFDVPLVIPGPTILLVVTYAPGLGRRTAAPVAVGVALGDLTAMTLSMLGAGVPAAARAGRLAPGPRALRLVNRAGGTALIGAGAAAALTARAA